MRFALGGLLPVMVLLCLSTHAQVARTDTAYVLVVDRSGAPIYSAEASASGLPWKGHADASGRIELPRIPVASDLLVTAQGFRPLVVKSDGSEVVQHRVVLEVGGGSTVQVQPSAADPQPTASAPLQEGVSAAVAAPAPPRKVRVSSGVIAGLKVKGEFPRFPEEAKAQHVNGAVVLHVIIGADGKVLDVTPISGPELLRKPYADAVRQWEYRPYLLNGRPTQVETTVTLDMSVGG